MQSKIKECPFIIITYMLSKKQVGIRSVLYYIIYNEVTEAASQTFLPNSRFPIMHNGQQGHLFKPQLVCVGVELQNYKPVAVCCSFITLHVLVSGQLQEKPFLFFSIKDLSLTIAVVNGMLSIKDEAKAETHTTNIMAIASRSSSGTP